jgi:hypothetical protein
MLTKTKKYQRTLKEILIITESYIKILTKSEEKILIITDCYLSILGNTDKRYLCRIKKILTNTEDN